MSVELCLCAPTAHPEVGSETPTAKRPHQGCLRPPGCVYFHVCMCKKTLIEKIKVVNKHSKLALNVCGWQMKTKLIAAMLLGMTPGILLLKVRW